MTKSDASTHVRCASILLVLLLLLSVVPIQAFASQTPEVNVVHYTLTGSFEGKFELSSNKYKLFHLEDIVPGDEWKGQIHIKNDADGKMTISLLSITSNIKNQVLFDALDLEISYKGNPLYSGKYNTGLTRITDEYVIDPDETLVLDVVVSLPVSAGNEVQDKYMDSTWTFEATYNEKPKTGGNLATENTLGLYILWTMIFALIGAAVISLRIRAIKKVRNAQMKEVNTK